MLAPFYGLYKRDRVGADNATLDEVWPIFNCVTVASFAVFAVVQAFAPASLHGGRVVAFWALASLAIPAYRSIARTLLRRQLALKQRAVVVGAGLVGQEIARKVLRQPSYGLDLVGFVDPNPLPAARRARSICPSLARPTISAELLVTQRHRPRRPGVHGRPPGRTGRRPRLQRDGRAGRHRAAPVRGRRQPRGGVLARGHAAARAHAARCWARRTASPSARWTSAARSSASSCSRRCSSPPRSRSAERQGPDLLPPDPHRPRPEAVHDHQVPHDGARRRGAQGRGRPPERPLRPRRRAHVQDPRRPAPDDGRPVPAQVLDRRVPAALERAARAR